MTTQQLSCQGCGAWSSEATKQDPDCLSTSGIIAINRLFSICHYLPLKLNLIAPLKTARPKKNQCGVISGPPSPPTVQSASKYSKGTSIIHELEGSHKAIGLTQTP